MKGPLFAFVALFLYAIANAIIEKKLGHISAIANTTCFYVGLLAMSAPLLLLRNHLGLQLTMPETKHFWILIGCGILFFFADLAWFQAYHARGRLEQIAAVFLVFPLLTSLMKSLGGGGLPTRSDLCSWLIVGIGLVISIRQPLNK